MIRMGFSMLLAALLFSSVAACSSSSSDTGIPKIESVMPSATVDSTGTNYDVTLEVAFDDSDSSGDLVSAFTFGTTNLTSGEVDDNDAALPTPSASPVTISGIAIPVADDNGVTSVASELTLYGTGGAGSVFDFTIDISSSRVEGARANAVPVTVTRQR